MKMATWFSKLSANIALPKQMPKLHAHRPTTIRSNYRLSARTFALWEHMFRIRIMPSGWKFTPSRVSPSFLDLNYGSGYFDFPYRWTLPSTTPRCTQSPPRTASLFSLLAPAVPTVIWCQDSVQGREYPFHRTGNL